MIVSIEDMVQQEYEKAKERARLLYSKATTTDRSFTEFTPSAILVTKTGDVLEPIDFGWSHPYMKKKMLTAVAVLASVLDAAAVITINESMSVNIPVDEPPFSAMMEEVDGDIDAFEALVKTWCKENYGPDLTSIPERFIKDILITMGHSEQGNISIAGFFNRTDKPIEFMEVRSREAMETLIPDWWKPPFQNGDTDPFIQTIRAKISNPKERDELVHHFREVVDYAMVTKVLTEFLSSVSGTKQ